MYITDIQLAVNSCKDKLAMDKISRHLEVTFQLSPTAVTVLFSRKLVLLLRIIFSLLKQTLVCLEKRYIIPAD